MTTQEPIADLVAAYLERVVNQRDLRAVHDVVAAHYTGGGHGWPQTREELVAFYTWQAAARPDWHIDVQQTVTVGSCVVVRALAGGTVTDDEQGRPLAAPTARRVEWLAAYWVTEGRIDRIQVLSLVTRPD